MEYKLIGYKEPTLFEFFDLKEYEAFKESDLHADLVPVYVAVEDDKQ